MTERKVSDQKYNLLQMGRKAAHLIFALAFAVVTDGA